MKVSKHRREAAPLLSELEKSGNAPLNRARAEKTLIDARKLNVGFG